MGSKKLIVGLCGRAGVGKSTVAKLLGAPTVSFAAPLKNMLKQLGLTDEHLYGSLKNEPLPQFGGKTTRFLMQSLGTEWGRNLVSEDIWTGLFKDAVAKLPVDLVLCDDVRYATEIKTLQEMGAILIEITRPGCGDGAHSSESLNFSDFGIPRIVNEGTPEDMVVKVKTLLYGR